MADLEKVIKGLNSCAKWMEKNDVDACNSCPYHSCDENNCIAMVNSEAIVLLKEQETIVRCKDCMHSIKKDEQYYCTAEYSSRIAFVPPDWYCHDGERK